MRERGKGEGKGGCFPRQASSYYDIKMGSGKVFTWT